MLQFPKFSISNSYALDEILPNLGFQDLFTSRADFSNISHGERLQLSKVSKKGPLTLRTSVGDICPWEGGGLPHGFWEPECAQSSTGSIHIPARQSLDTAAVLR